MESPSGTQPKGNDSPELPLLPQAPPLPYFGDYALETLEAEPELVDRFIGAKITEGLAPKTVANLLLDPQLILQQAVRWRLMSSNPVSGAERRPR